MAEKMGFIHIAEEDNGQEMENVEQVTSNNIEAFDPTQSHLVNPIEWKFIYKIFEDNNLYMDTKVSFEYFTDPLAQVVYSIMGKYISQLGEFKILLHLKDFCQDEVRMDNYKKFEYPLEINFPTDIYEWVMKFQDDEVKFKTLEWEMQKQYQKRHMKSWAYEILEEVEDSNASMSELTAKMSFRFDKLLYQSEEDVQAKSTKEVTQDMIAYLNSDEVDEYIPTTIDAIDRQCGGTTVPALICWAANAKVGKSALLIETIVKNLLQGRTVSVYSIEMNINEVMLRIYARYAGVDFIKIGKKTYTSAEKERLINATLEFDEVFKDRFFIYYNPNGISSKTIEVHLSRLKKSGIIIEDIFVDYLQLLDSSTKPKGSKVEKMTEVPKEMRMLAQKMNLRIFLPAQLHSSSEDKKIEDLNGDDIYYAKEIAREAHILCVIHKEDGRRKFKYVLSRFPYDQSIYFFPKLNLDRMYFGDVEEWDDSYKIENESEKKQHKTIKSPSWDRKV